MMFYLLISLFLFYMVGFYSELNRDSILFQNINKKQIYLKISFFFYFLYVCLTTNTYSFEILSLPSHPLSLLCLSLVIFVILLVYCLYSFQHSFRQINDNTTSYAFQFGRFAPRRNSLIVHHFDSTKLC